MTVAKMRDAKVKVCATEGGTYYELGDYVVNRAAGWRSAQLMDTTKMGDTAARAESSGFYAPTLDVTLHRNSGDTNGQQVILANNPVWIQYAEDGSTFYKLQMAWDETSNHGAGADKQTVNLSLRAAGGAAPAAV